MYIGYSNIIQFVFGLFFGIIDKKTDMRYIISCLKEVYPSLAEGIGLENREAGQARAGVQIPLPPPFQAHA